MMLPAAAEKRAVVEAMFDRIARRYDRMNRVMTLGLDRRWRQQAIAGLALARGERVLDLGCGTGDLAEEAARVGARAVGIDLSAGMLAVARQRGIAGLALVRGDALRLPLANGACDAAVSGFALRNLTAIAPALVECARVLRPGGRLALLEIDTPRSPWLRAGHRLWFHGVVPWVGRLLADRDAYSYLPSSAAYLPDEAGLRGVLAAAGFADVRKRRFAGGAVQILFARRPGDADV
jgi:demethylmenaquinone methyltransferase/2-methoxy-6-polyprenyl-1,4-benzoquinol methylase